MQTMRFSEATDVWSFGIVMIELFTDGDKPYAGMANAAVISKVQGGFRAEQPALCTDEIYSILLQCWSAKSSDRPTFTNLVAMLTGMLPEQQAPEQSSSASVNPASNPTSQQTLAADDVYSEVVYERIMTSNAEAAVNVSPLELLPTVRLVGFRAAVKAAIVHLSCNLDAEIEKAIAFAQRMVRQGRNQGASVDQVASVHMYTQVSPFYKGLNGALGGWGQGGRGAAVHYLPYCKLALGGLRLLPKVVMVVYRGVQTVPLDILLGGKRVNDILTWYAFTSTTGTPDVLQDEEFFGRGTNERTVFKINIKTGVRVKGFSDFGCDLDYYAQAEDSTKQNEDEVLLFPGTRLRIVAITKYDSGVTEVELTEVVDELQAIEGRADATGVCADGYILPVRSDSASADMHHSSNEYAEVANCLSEVAVTEAAPRVYTASMSVQESSSNC